MCFINLVLTSICYVVSLLGHPEAAVANRRSGELISERSATSWAVPLQAVSAENFLVLQRSKTIHKLQ